MAKKQQYHVASQAEEGQSGWTTPTIGQKNYGKTNQTKDETRPVEIHTQINTTTFNSWLRFLVVNAFLMLAAAVAFLSWLWFDYHESIRWREFMFSPYAPQAITICSVLIRTALGILATITTSMVAAIILETRGVPLDALLPISIVRYTNTGPSTLAAMSPRSLGISMYSLILLLLGLTLASQFSSTILFYDLAPAYIQDTTKTTINSYTFQKKPKFTDTSMAIQGLSQNYFAQRPSTFGIFAEYSEPAPQYETDDIDDTGVTIRALLPLASQAAREGVHEFRGMARVIDSRVRCFRPELSDIRVCGKYYICGKMSRRELPKNIWALPTLPPWDRGLSTKVIEEDFQCKISGDSLQTGVLATTELPWSLCRRVALLRQTPFLLNTTISDTDIESFNQSWSYTMSDSGDSMLLLNHGQLRDNRGKNITNETAWDVLQSNGEGPWTHHRVRRAAQVGDGTQTFDISASWCVESSPNTPISHLNITASTNSPLKEPTYSIHPDSNRFDLNQLQNQLKADADTSTEARQILTITPEDMQASLSAARDESYNPDIHSDLTRWMTARSQPYDVYDIIMNAIVDKQSATQGVDLLSAYIFTDTLNKTNSPARAIQAFRTTQYRSIYYDHISAFDRSNTMAQIDSFVRINTPTGRTGFAVVMALTAAQCLIFFALLWRFSVFTDSSLLWNGWTAIAQVSSSEDARMVLSSSTVMTDGQVRSLVDHGNAMPNHRPSAWDGFSAAVIGVVRWPGRFFERAGIRYMIREGVVVKKGEKDS